MTGKQPLRLMALAGIPTDILIVFSLILIALLLFVSELIPNDVTAIGIIVTLAVLGPIIGLSPRDAISGFANTATVTILAMYMLSAGIQETGVVSRLGYHLITFARGDESRALLATVWSTGPIAGFINNTPVVAIFIPMITELADRTNTSPSKLLLPLSYAAILGGTLTLIGTATNILASDFARQLIPGRNGIGMFEFTPLGIIIFLVGIAYLLTIGRRLTPARIPVRSRFIDEFDLENHLAQVALRPDSVIIGDTINDFDATLEQDIDVLQLHRDNDVFTAPFADERLQPDDVLVVHGTLQAINQFTVQQNLRYLSREDVTDETFDDASSPYQLGKAVLPPDSSYVGKTIGELNLEAYHHTTVLAIRRPDELIRENIAETTLTPGDLLLLRYPPAAVGFFAETSDLIITTDQPSLPPETPGLDYPILTSHAPIAIAILAGVVLAAALNLAPIVIAALGGVVAMVVTGCLEPADAYDAVSWNIIFLLAGVIPLGLAMENTGGAAFLADFLIATQAYLPLIGIVFLFYLLTGLFSNVITPVATVVLMIPVAVDAAISLGANPFSFLLAVMFASATSFMTPIGYQTNLMIYGPGGYRFTDFLKVGGPLQFILAIITTIGITIFWGLS